mmetsp:Transcript_3864/g.9453  ORF Transcript_3864/g.9453 Transcript_3864/m.9453 type:complete len:549 (-) Transcript_3864:106-1752(-)
MSSTSSTSSSTKKPSSSSSSSSSTSKKSSKHRREKGERGERSERRKSRKSGTSGGKRRTSHRRRVNFGLSDENESAPLMLLRDGGDGIVRQHFSWSSKDVLGAGAFAKVYAGTSLASGEKVAIKVIDKKIVGKEVTPRALQTEVAVLKGVQHPYVIQLRGVYEDEHNLYIVTELACGGELFDRVLNKGAYTEADAATMVKRLLSAIKYLHDKGIVHRDLKPENLLLASKDNDLDIRIADFGLARVVGSNTLIQSVVGSPNYVAPEVLQGKGYWKQADLWSIGVITYILLCGYPPFTSPDIRDLLDMIQSGEYEYEEDYWSGVSADAKDFIDHLLVVDPDARYDVDQALKHKWFTEDEAKLTKNLTIGGKLKETLEQWRDQDDGEESESEELTNEDGGSATMVMYDMRARPPGDSAPITSISITRCKPSAPFYSFLYDNLADYQEWKRVKNLEEAELQQLVDDPSMVLFVANANGCPVAFIELQEKPSVFQVRCLGAGEADAVLASMLLDVAVAHVWSSPATVSLRFQIPVDAKPELAAMLLKAGFSKV